MKRSPLKVRTREEKALKAARLLLVKGTIPAHRGPTKLKPVGKRGKRLAPEDRKWREAVRERAKGICEECGKPGTDAHHIQTRSAHPELRHELDNGRFLCRECHQSAHGGGR